MDLMPKSWDELKPHRLEYSRSTLIHNCVPPCGHTSAETDAAYQDLALAVRGARGFVNDKIIRGAVAPLHVPGLVAAERIEAKEILLLVPGSLLIMPSTVAEVEPELWNALCALQGEPKPKVAQAIFMARLLRKAECHDHSPKGDVSDGISGHGCAIAGDRDVSRWSVWERYASLILGTDLSTHPMWRAAIEPDTLHTKFGASHEFAYFIKKIRDIVDVYRILSERCAAEVLEVSGESIELRLLIHASVALISRAFTTCSRSAYVPVADIFNHHTKPGCYWHWSEDAKVFVVAANRAHSAGEELFISYGEFSNFILYRHYGFTLMPEFEPVWTHTVPAEVVRCESGLGTLDQITLVSTHVHKSLSDALNLVHAFGVNVVNFLRNICTYCQFLMTRDEKFRPALDALMRSRTAVPISYAWWAEVKPADIALRDDDMVRIKMSAYLCIVAHLEALEVAIGALSESRCFEVTKRFRESLKLSLQAFEAHEEVVTSGSPRHTSHSCCRIV